MSNSGEEKTEKSKEDSKTVRSGDEQSAHN
jgi:hypothetical protein